MASLENVRIFHFFIENPKSYLRSSSVVEQLDEDDTSGKEVSARGKMSLMRSENMGRLSKWVSTNLSSKSKGDFGVISDGSAKKVNNYFVLILFYVRGQQQGLVDK